jgi:hypothetical protein
MRGLLPKIDLNNNIYRGHTSYTPGALSTPLLAAGPAVMYLVLENHTWQVAWQTIVAALVCIVGEA